MKKVSHVQMALKPNHSVPEKAGLRPVLAAGALAVAMAYPSLPVHAGTTDLASSPMVTSNSASVLPNLMFILDDSGSMSWNYMPDTVNSFGGAYGYSSSQCNGVYYDPTVTYYPPVDATGASYANSSFTAARSDGFNSSSGTVNLSTSFRVDSSLSSQAAFYYVYSGTQTTPVQKDYLNSNSTFYKECNSNIGSTPGSSVFTKVIVSSTSGPGGTDERTNFANWYTYYRTRMLMMKTAAGRAFKPIDNRYRVGYMSINNNTGADYLNIDTFDATQKTAWYAKLYAATPSNSTPLRVALSNAGRLYAGKLSSLNGQSVTDPVQYSCQQNFTLLSTDGYWNGGAGFKLDGTTAVGNQDGTASRPQLDGASTTYQRSTTQVLQTQTQYTSQMQMQTSALQKRTGALQQRTSSNGGFSWSSWSNTASCTWDNSSSSRTACRYNWGSWSNTATTCTVSYSTSTANSTTWSGDGTDCQYGNWSSWSNVASCTAVAQSASSPYTVTSATQCQTALTNPTTVMAATPVASCTPVAASSGNGYLATTCTNNNTGPTTVYSCTADTASAANNWTTTTCSSGTSSGGTSDTLADVAQYYYMTDLRTSALGNATGALGNDVTGNNVPTSGLDGASWQHMTTFTLGLGARGRMVYLDSSYDTMTSGDYYSVKAGLTANPSAGVCSWQSSGTVCNWPTPGADQPENIDDLWHAAVNGRGKYFSATNPTTLASSISDALSGVSARTAASAAATTSNPNVTSGDNYVFESTFLTAEWHGELVRRQIDTSNGAPMSNTDWQARDQLDVNGSRTIYTFDSGSGNKLRTFQWSSLTATEQGYFSLANLLTLTQFCASGSNCLSSADQTAAAGAPLVNFLRGDRSNEGTLSNTAKYFRQRQHVLGDIVNAEAVYVRGSLYTYADTGYSGFASSNATRTGMVYVAANDGMLHAFNGNTGAEAWAYVPTMVMPSMYKLADKDYANKHQFFLDGTPVVGDAYIGGAWRTLLVGGMNAGGRGYYALDITNPASPKGLWEFADTNLGYTYGNPVITKLKDGTWVVIVTSGYNNVTPGDGVGRLYVLDAATGAVIRTISTGVGSAGTPSGLSRIAAWVDNSMTDNTAQRVYGGDLLGNVWRFDINNDVGAAGYDAQLLVTLRDPSGNPQPITAKPELGMCGTTPMALVGTGRFLGTSDMASTQQQSFYGVKDTLGSATFSNPRTSGNGFVQQTLTTGVCPSNPPGGICVANETVRMATSNTVNLSSDNGWYIDFPESGERAYVDPALVLGTLTFNTNIPGSSACTIGGESYTNYLNYCTGGAVSTTGGIASVKLGNALATRPVVVVLPNNSLVALTRMADGTTKVKNQPPPNAPGTTRRVSWRELFNDQ